MIEFSLIQKLILWAIPVIFAITLHEVAHGLVATLKGDCTAKMLGRLTVNPIKHIDLIGTVIVPIALFMVGGFIFGWAKPIPVNPRNFKNPKKDMALVAIAGPIANLIMAIFWTVVLKVAVGYIPNDAYPSEAIAYMAQIGIMVNLILAILNLIPLPPLDGSRVVSALLPGHLEYYYNKIEPYGFIILLLLLITGILGHIMMPIYLWILSLLHVGL